MSVQSIAAALDDLVCGREVRKTVVDGVAHVDYNAYIEQFKQALARMKEAKQEAEAPLESTVSAATDEEVRIFGGTGGP